MNRNRFPCIALVTAALLLTGCDQSGGSQTQSDNSKEKHIIDQGEKKTNVQRLNEELDTLLQADSGGLGLAAYTLPDSDDFNAIPQDPNNTITAEKVVLGQAFFHDNRFALNGRSDQSETWSCSTCHQMASGFKPGIAQGIGEGGIGVGTQRRLAPGFDPQADDEAINKPDMQPIAVPTVLNVAYQDVVLWNGQLGNAINGIANSSVAADRLLPDTLPSVENRRQLAGIETQAIAGQRVHRLRFDSESPLQSNQTYQQLWNAAFNGASTDTQEDVGKSIAAFERTVLANRAPFQRWLRGDKAALNESELRGATLFFGKAGCSDCHRGPALSSEQLATEEQLFFAIGFDDFDNNKVAIHGPIASDARLGRGGFTGNSSQHYQFKVPQLYNLADADIYGHGASFRSIRDVVNYKNDGVAQNPAAVANLDVRFQPLGLSIREVNELTTFLSTALYDPDLSRYVPQQLP